MIYRKAKPEDLKSIYGIEQRVFNSPWSLEQLKWELEAQPAAVNFVVEKEDRVIGYIFLHKTREEAQILNIAVDIPYQHRGLGYKLIDNVLKNYFESIDVYLEVNRTNFPAINLYLKQGFKEIGICEKYYEDGEDAMLMVKQAIIHGMV